MPYRNYRNNRSRLFRGSYRRSGAQSSFMKKGGIQKYRPYGSEKVEGAYREAVHYRIRLFTGSGEGNQNQYQIDWHNAYAAVANNTYSISNGSEESGLEVTPQLVHLANFFKVMQPYGLKLEYRPINNGAQQISPIDCGSVVPVTDNAGNDFHAYGKEWANARDLKVYDPTKPFKRYYRIWKFIEDYRSADPYINTVSYATGSVNDRTAVTCLRFNGSVQNALIGYLDLTWYVRAKDRITKPTQINA